MNITIICQDGREELVHSVPQNPDRFALSVDIVADEMARACQRAYEIGRQDQREAFESGFADLVRKLKAVNP